MTASTVIGFDRNYDTASPPRTQPGDSPHSQVAPLSSTPMSEKHLRKNRIVAPFLGEPAAEIFRQLRTRVLQRMAKRGARTLGICSATKSEGKSLIALNLAISIALDMNHSAVLVEADFRQPRLHQMLDRNAKAGLVDVLEDRAGLEDALIDIGYPRLQLLPAVTQSEMSAELLSSPRMSSISRQILDRHTDGIIIYDLPPVLASDDCLSFMDNLDCCLFVVGNGNVSSGALAHAIDLIGRDKLMGTVLNVVSRAGAKRWGRHAY